MKRYISSLMAVLAVAFVTSTPQVMAQDAEDSAATTNAPSIVEQVGSQVLTAPEPVVEKVGEKTDIQVLGVKTSVKSSFWLDEIPFLKDKEFQGTPLWQYLAFCIYLVIAYFVSLLLAAGIFSLFHLIYGRKETILGKLMMQSLRKPVRLILFVVLLSIGLKLYRWPDWMANFLGKLFTLGVAISITFAFVKVVDIIFSFWKEKTSADATFANQIIPLFGRIVKYIVIFIGMLMMASNLGIDITSVLALGSVGGLAVGLATQDLLNNVFGGVVVFLDKPFRIGEHVLVEGKDGTVESIGLRSTRIRCTDGSLATIPNKTICNSIVTNMSNRIEPKKDAGK